MINTDDGKVLVRYDTADNWQAANPILAKGETIIVIVDGKQKLKCGDGANRYNNLPFILGDGGETKNVTWGEIIGKPTEFTPSEHNHDSRYYTETEIDTKLNDKASKSTTLAGYGITDAYTKTETDTKLNGKANSNHTHSQYLTSTSSVYEANLLWGNKSVAGDVTPNDMGCIDEFGHNKLAFLPAECITVEYSIDGGETWIDYGFTDAEKIALVTTSGRKVIIGGGTVDATKGTLTNDNCSNYLARVTISAWKNNNSNGVYTSAVKWLINYSSTGATGGAVKVETRTIGNRLNNTDVWVDRGTHTLSGWSGWNSINIPNLKFGGSTTQTSQIAEFRFTLSIQSVSSNTGQAQFIDFRLIGKTNWTMPSEMARAGHLYTVDTARGAKFPAIVQATSFNENGTTLSAKYLGIKAKAESSKSADSVAWANVSGKPTFFSGNYNDLTNKPTIPPAYELPKASSTTLGGIKVGNNLTIDENGVLSAVGGGGVPDMTDYVVERGNTDDGWYVLYKSGWVEQGGSGQTAGSSPYRATVTFPKPFADMTYTCVSTQVTLSTDSGNITNTRCIKIDSTKMYVGSGVASTKYNWQAFGFAQ